MLASKDLQIPVILLEYIIWVVIFGSLSSKIQRKGIPKPIPTMKRLSSKQQQPSPPIKTALPLKNRRKQQKLSINYPQLSISIIYPRKKVSTPQQKITCNALGLDLDLRLEGPHREAKQLVRLMDRNPVIVDNYTSIVTNDYHTNNRLIG